MPDAEPNHADRWPAPPHPGVELGGAGVAARLVEEPDQALVSGDLAAFGRASGIDPFARGEGQGAYALRLARDRILVVGALPGLAPGWHPDGFALTATGAALSVIELAGPGIPDLLAKGTVIDPANPGPSAAATFAGIPAVLDLAQGRARLHVERGLVAYLWSWLAAELV